MGKQSEIVRTTEGDAWWERNKDKDREPDPVLKEVFENPRLVAAKSILEIGCGTGWRLHRIWDRFRNNECRGCDLSWQAIEEGRRKFPGIGLRVAAADSVGYPSNHFDLVILGFFMYLVDREDLFKVVSEADRVLKDGGALVLHDFVADSPHSKVYAHHTKLTTYKMGYHKLFLANPSYSLEQFTTWGEKDGREGVFTMRKDHEAGWPRS